MKVTPKIISIPPYISTSWRNVHSVHMTDGVLIITLNEGNAVYIPDLTLQEIDLIFKAHAAFLEEQQTEKPEPARQPQEMAAAMPGLGGLTHLLQSMLGQGSEAQPIRIAFSNLENLGAMMQHDQAQADSPNLPSELLEKIASITKLIPHDDPNSLPKAEPHCNCFHCQIARALGSVKEESQPVTQHEPEIKSEELRFQQWEVQQIGDNLYSVTNKLDSDEKYSVFLGQPLGCTCGRPGCEHIVAVLQS